MEKQMTNNKDSAVLDPCPWCQKTPKHGDSSYGYWTVFCGDENECPVSPHVEAPTEDEAIAAWHARQPTQSDALRGAMELAIHENGPIVLDWMGDQLGWRALDGEDWTDLKEQAQPTQSDALKAAAEAIRGLLDITSEYNLDSEQAGRAYAALHDIDAALQEQSK
jgi:hypothetical protein